jgi:hypothetical protein
MIGPGLQLRRIVFNAMMKCVSLEGHKASMRIVLHITTTPITLTIKAKHNSPLGKGRRRPPMQQERKQERTSWLSRVMYQEEEGGGSRVRKWIDTLYVGIRKMSKLQLVVWSIVAE